MIETLNTKSFATPDSYFGTLTLMFSDATEVFILEPSTP